jgi:hypothetical protein
MPRGNGFLVSRLARQPPGDEDCGPGEIMALTRPRIRDTASDQPHKKPGQHKSAEQHGPITHVELKETAVCCNFYIWEHGLLCFGKMDCRIVTDVTPVIKVPHRRDGGCDPNATATNFVHWSISDPTT